MMKIWFSKIVSWAKAHPARAGAIGGWFQQGCTTLGAILLIPIVTSHLSIVNSGIWFSFQGLIVMIGLMDLGFGFAISRQAAYTLGIKATIDKIDGDFIPLSPGWKGVKQLQIVTQRLYMILAIASLLVGLLAYEIFSRWGNLVPKGEEHTRWAWYCMVFAAANLIAVGGMSAFLNGLGAVYQTRIIAGLYQLAASLGAAIAAFLGWGIIGMAACFAACSLVYRLAMKITLRYSVPELISLKLELYPIDSLRKLAKAAIPIGGVNIFGSLIYAIQAPLLGMLLGPDKVAPFYLAQRFSSAFNMLVMHTALPQLPFFTRLLGHGDKLEAARNMRKTIFRTIFLGFLTCMAFYLLSPWMAKALLKKVSYIDSTTLFFMTLDLACLSALAIPGQYVLAAGSNPFIVSTICTGLASFLLSVYLPGIFGVSGLPLASLIAGLAFNYRLNVMKCVRLYSKLKN